MGCDVRAYGGLRGTGDGLQLQVGGGEMGGLGGGFC